MGHLRPVFVFTLLTTPMTELDDRWLSTQRTIQGVQFNPQLAELLRQVRPEEALYFPTFDTQVKS